ncbi:hypothetical protein [Streptomyces brasiliensis]|uniref:hypothetical protein n=1 Tax=Streptomyces brasiliensis TaxID=1954 RepID=UPI0027E58A94|nr:hypothetical protein [Streptomyces brasiliensis]
MPIPVLDGTALETLLTAAVAAPSIHNTQPWRFRLDPRHQVLKVHGTAERSLPLADPEGRARHLSVGAALFNLRVVATHWDRQPRVRLLPAPAEPDLPATVHLTGSPDPDHCRRGDTRTCTRPSRDATPAACRSPADPCRRRS